MDNQAAQSLGLSAGAILDSYLKLGGTLGQPSVEVKPLSDATGLELATSGLSILAEGLFGRLVSGAKVCRRARKKAGIE